jgi:hypothetical protein
MCPVQSEINLILAKVTHRLDQLTKPTFDRATVEELLAEIFRLRSAEHRHQVAKEIAWRDNKIDELTEANEEQDEEIQGLQETVVLQRGRIDDLEAVNASLSKHLSEALLGSRGPTSQPNRLPMRPLMALNAPMELTDDGLAVPLSEGLHGSPHFASQMSPVPSHPSRLALVRPAPERD